MAIHISHVHVFRSVFVLFLLIFAFFSPSFYFFFFNDSATTEIYTLSLHDALPISLAAPRVVEVEPPGVGVLPQQAGQRDRKSTRLNSSHLGISYAVFCLKKKKNSNGRVDVPVLQNWSRLRSLDDQV